MNENSLQPGRFAVITGAAGGIGYAVAERLASLRMKVCIADSDERKLDEALARLRALPAVGRDDVLAVPTDVSDLSAVQRLKDRVTAAGGDIGFLMNNAAIGIRGGPWTDHAAWQRLLNVNLWGVINGLQTFVADMVSAGKPAIIVNVGSKQGITTPPGNAAYNVAKAGVKVVTEQLAHELRQLPGCGISAHLLIPGFTHTGMTGTANGGAPPPVKPPGAWTAAQVADFMLEELHARKFYILCPDEQTTAEMDRRRIQWSADDLILGRPALSRWDPGYAAQFAQYMAAPSRRE